MPTVSDLAGRPPCQFSWINRGGRSKSAGVEKDRSLKVVEMVSSRTWIESIIASYGEVLRRMALIKFMAQRNRRAQLADTALGVLWDLVTPASNMAIYYFLIAIVFQRSAGYPAPAYLFIIIGISHYLFLQRMLSASFTVYRANNSILMQIPLEPLIFYAMELRRALAELAVYVFLCAVLYFSAMETIPATIVFYPVLLLLFIVLAWSLGVIFATACVFMRDIANLMSIVIRLALYGSAVIYPLTFLPEQFQSILLVNPLAIWFSLSHWALYGAPPPPAASIAMLLAFVAVSLVFGHWLHATCKNQFTKAF